jgi:hypothetical protein
VTDSVLLHYGNRDVTIEKSARFIAIRARAGMETAMLADIAAVTARWRKKRLTADDFRIIETRSAALDLEQDLDWFRARPSVAAASHVFQIKGEAGLLVPNGHIHLIFDEQVDGHRHQIIFTHYRLQRVEERGRGDYLVRITKGSNNPIITAAALQKETEILHAEPELIRAS